MSQGRSKSIMSIILFVRKQYKLTSSIIIAGLSFFSNRFKPKSDREEQDPKEASLSFTHN